MKLLVFTFFAFLGFVHPIVSQVVGINSAPSWVTDITSKREVTDNRDVDGGFRYQLVDHQVNIQRQEVYSHQVIEILNSNGINSHSDIKVVFDPKYQTLNFHTVRIYRGSETLNKLSVGGINTFQRESAMERNLYDGSYTSVINLTDVRVGDIIEYAYSIQGFNPIYQGHFYDKIYLQYSIPIDKIFSRVISNKQLNIKLKEGAQPPNILETNGKYEYSWEINDQPPWLLDSNVPAWFEPYQIVELSSFSSWAEVVSWALPHYQISDGTFRGVDKIKQIYKGTGNKGMTVLEIIRFVQDEIRYLGFESGIGAYKPNAPSEVFSHRYGDCKDKTLLLVSLLNEIGIDAYPVFVNSLLGQKLSEALPSPKVFDHVVVMIEFQDNVYYIDPTITFQGGDLANNYFPDYGYGLIIKKGNSELVKLPIPQKSNTLSKELFVIDNFEDKAVLTVRTEYKGSAADFQRRYHLSNDQGTIQKEFLNFYSYLYPSIEPAEAIKIYDYNRYSDNLFIVEENYSIEGLWNQKEASGTIYFEIYPLLLESYINFQNSARRTMPYYLGEPKLIVHQTIIELPEEWSANEKVNRIEGDGFYYESSINLDYNTLEVIHRYQTDKDHIDAASVEKFIKQHQDIRNTFSFEVSYNQALSGFKLSWFTVAVIIITLIAGIIYARKVYFEYDPQPWVYAENLSIGGWLVLIAIGITVTPLRLLFEVASDQNLFNHNTWILLMDGENFAQSVQIGILLLAELIYNCLFFVFGMLIVILFFTRRTSLPRLIIIYFSVNIAAQLLDLSALYIISPELYAQSEPNQSFLDIGRAVVAAAIWIPYFNYSERVKSTFCKSFSHV